MASWTMAAVVLAALLGAGLFWLLFAAAFVGSWTLFCLALTGFAVAGAGFVRRSRLDAVRAAAALVAFFVPASVLFFVASVPEVGLFVAGRWLLLVGLCFALAWGAGAWTARRSDASARRTDADA